MLRRVRKALYGWLDKQFLDGCSRYNALDVRRNARTKVQARQKFEQHGIPFAKGKAFVWPGTAFRFVRDHGFPVVVKPNLGGYSRGSYFPIQTRGELLKAILLAKLWWPKSIIERYLKGNNYRVVVTKTGVKVVMRRYPPFVVGDGESSIRELVAAENAVRREMNLLPVIHEIPFEKEQLRHLKKQGKTWDFIPAKGEEVELFHRVALAPGGVLETVDIAQIPEKNLQLFQKILELFDANVLGIDVIMEQGIEIPYDEQETIFLEVNTRPYLKMHHYPRWGDVPDMKALYAELDALHIDDLDVF